MNSFLKMTEDGLSETRGRAMKLKELFKEAHQWFSEVIQKITELQEGVAMELTRISTPKAIRKGR